MQSNNSPYVHRKGLLDIPLTYSDLSLFCGGNSPVINGTRKAGYAVVILHQSLQSYSLTLVTRACLAKLIFMIRAL